MKNNEILKYELLKSVPEKLCCKITALKVAFRLYGTLHLKNGGMILEFRHEDSAYLRRVVPIFYSVFAASKGMEIQYNRKYYWVNFPVNMDILEKLTIFSDEKTFLPKFTLKNSCCRKRFLKELLLYKGYLFPFKDSYQLEIRDLGVFKTHLKAIFKKEGIKFYLYNERLFVKGIENLRKLFDFLSLKENLKKLEEFKEYRETKNRTIRLTNYNIANLTRQVASYERYKKIIEHIDAKIGISSLPYELYEIAKKRLENPSMSFSELANALDTPVSKGTIQRRMKKLEAIFEELGGKDEE